MNKKGLTLIEILVATTIFITAITIVVGVFSNTIKEDQRQIVRRNLQAESRAAFEEIVRSTRLAKGTATFGITVGGCNNEKFPAIFTDDTPGITLCGLSSPPNDYLAFSDIQSEGSSLYFLATFLYPKEVDGNTILYQRKCRILDTNSALSGIQGGACENNAPEQPLFSPNAVRFSAQNCATTNYVFDDYVINGLDPVCFTVTQSDLANVVGNQDKQPFFDLIMKVENIPNTASSPYGGTETAEIRTFISSRGYYYNEAGDNMSRYPIP